MLDDGIHTLSYFHKNSVKSCNNLWLFYWWLLLIIIIDDYLMVINDYYDYLMINNDYWWWLLLMMIIDDYYWWLLKKIAIKQIEAVVYIRLLGQFKTFCFLFLR